MTATVLRSSLPRRWLTGAVLFGATVLGLAQTTGGGAPPQLRIDTGAHSGAIRAIATDAAGRYIVTASEDKTARVWDAASGRLLRALRPASASGNDGKLFAAAVAPDAGVIAVGGWSASNDVYLFDRGTGALVQRITGLPDVVTRLVFSPDGRALAISLWGRSGLRLYSSGDAWRTSRETASDTAYGGESYGSAFSPDGRQFVTTSYDGQLRSYTVSGDAERRLTLAKTVRAEGGLQPFGIAFSPDGQSLALGFGDAPAVRLLSAATLAALTPPSAAGSTEGNSGGALSTVAWAADGRTLYAAGSWKRGDGRHLLRRWALTGPAAFGPPADTVVARDSVAGLVPLANGQIAFAATDASWGLLGAAGEPTVFQAPMSAGVPPAPGTVASGLTDLRGARSGFRVARDGGALSFPAGASATRAFDVRNAEWTDANAQWTAPQASAHGLTLDQWFESAQPMLNRRALPLADNELSLSATVATGGAGFALGTNFFVRYYRADGSLLWRTSAPGSTWQVNLSADGRWLIAGFADGTVRWFRTSDGTEQLALLPHADGKRWVAWTPRGFYAASPGGEDLFGWQMDNGPSRAADFFPGSRFRAGYFRPDVIAQVIGTSDTQTALVSANQDAGRKPPPEVVAAAPVAEVPPVVTILSPGDGGAFDSREVTLRVEVRTVPGAPVLELGARRNGQLFKLPQGSAASWLEQPVGGDALVRRYEQRIALPPEDSELMLFAENRNGFSAPATVRLRWSGGRSAPMTAAATLPSAPLPLPSSPSGEPDLRPALYVLAIGVSKYASPDYQLDYAAKDATDFSRVFQQQESQLYRKVEVRLLTDGKARRDDVLEGLEWIRRQATARDVAVVFLAGHGVNDDDGVYYYLPQDADADRLKRTGVIFTEIRNTVTALPGKVLFFIDTCHAGNVFGTARRSAPRDLTAMVNELSSAENGVIVFAASTGRQFAQESTRWGNGAFTLAVVEGMSGKADFSGSGRVTHKMLDLYVSERVKEMTRGKQSPVTIVPQGVPDFPVAAVKPRSG